MKSKKFFKIAAASVAALAFAGTLTSCKTKTDVAREDLANEIVSVLNENQDFTSEHGSLYNFDIKLAEKDLQDDAVYFYVNGITTQESEEGQKAYSIVTIKGDKSLYEQEEKDIDLYGKIKTSLEENGIESFSKLDLANVKDFEKAIEKTSDIPYDGYETDFSSVYKVWGAEFNENNNSVSFNVYTKTQFSKLDRDVTWGIVGYVDGKAEWGWVVDVKRIYQTAYFNKKVYIKLSEEDFAKAKEDDSIIIDKFCEYVNNGEKDKYVIQDINYSQSLNKDLSEIASESSNF